MPFSPIAAQHVSQYSYLTPKNGTPNDGKQIVFSRKQSADPEKMARADEFKHKMAERGLVLKNEADIAVENIVTSGHYNPAKKFFQDNQMSDDDKIWFMPTHHRVDESDKIESRKNLSPANGPDREEPVNPYQSDQAERDHPETPILSAKNLS